MTRDPHRRLLFNMSTPPKTTIAYGGLSDLAQWPADAPDRSSQEARLPAPWLALQFCVSKGSPTDAPGILAALGADASPDPEATLESLIEERARQLPLPDGCLVLPAKSASRRARPDLLTAIAVIVKCSEFVWLRQKSPSLERLERVSEVALLVPAVAAQSMEEAIP
jgi:hypothetical protein